MEFDVQSLSCSRGGMMILADVSFHLAAGEALILRGPNGAGKTTLLRTLAGLTPAVSGTLKAPAEAIAYAAHADGLKAQLSVFENLMFWAGIFGQSNIDDAVEAFELAPLLERRAGNLSAGQKRRLSLARMLVTGRPIWCMDEPTVSLDVKNTERFSRAVEAHLAGSGIAVIATHIDLGLPQARTLDITPFMTQGAPVTDVADPFLSEGPL